MVDYPIQARVVIDGTEAYASVDDLSAGHPTVLDNISFSWGRDSITDQPAASSASFNVRQQTGYSGTTSLFDAVRAGSRVQIYADSVDESRLVWAGEITTATVEPAGDHAISAAVTCIDPSSMFNQYDIGADPWPEQPAGDRFNAILEAAGIQLRDLRPNAATGTPWSWTPTGAMDDSLTAPLVAFRDVDAQKPLDLIQDLAQSVGGVAWITADDSGPYVWIEDPTRRQGLRMFVIDATTGDLSIGELPTELAHVNRWTAADIVRDPLQWDQDPSQAVNLVEVQWQRRDGTNDEGNPAYEEATVQRTYSDSDRGIRSLNIETELIDDADAGILATRTLGQIRTSDWIVSTLQTRSDVLRRPVPEIPTADRQARFLDLLDCWTRIGYRMTITELPDYAPTGTQQSYYVEGGSYTWESGRWKLDLTVSANAIGGGAHGDQFPPGVTLADFPGITGRDVWGVAPPNLVSTIVPFTIPARMIGPTLVREPL